ncbi:caspase, EACC1-associated type [Streptomyces europaeiscabiei]|uniref:caspase, EACC1-associated type n=1 Tax=Streptomyces europaeiscabiei TaxID=146819 RepID=UPI0029A8F16D|nr:AAA domain-containing protein [Streptomyces europaeiscabiei]MDX2760727.1 AAA domain-containing protein [Streptomyces europaeiscabiei]
MSRKHALLVGTAAYEDVSFPALPSVRADVHYLAQVLEMPAVGRYEKCVRVEDSSKAAIKQAVEHFLKDREPDELVVLYLSGHGVYDREDGQLYYVTTDTEADRIQQTALEASYVTDQLEKCAARRKVLLLDCCFSGSAVQGFRSKGASPSATAPVVEASGVFVITASQHWEQAFTTDADQPSQFTRAMVEGLHSGQADLDGDGHVSANDLFRYISRDLRKAPDGRRQTPTQSSLQVTGDIYLADAAAGRQIPALKPLPAGLTAVTDTAGGVTPARAKAIQAVHDDSAFTDTDWAGLLTYYQHCLEAENSTDELLPLLGSDPPRVVWPAGEEVLLSGTEATVQAPERVVELAERALKDGADLWYGYPVAVLYDGRRQVCAPLAMRQIEVERGPQGRSVVTPTGPIVLHPKLVLDRLGKDEGKELLAAYQPNWRPGFREDMVRDLRSLLQEMGLPDTEHLDPGSLGDGASLYAAHEGARNVAVVFAARSDSAATAQLMKDYKTLQKSIGQFADTALGAFTGGADSEADERAEQEVQVVAPLELNEGQEAVIRAAMVRRLTVATGPPGTGKSQLIVNAVATARAAGQTVLVASTNNKAVDEVWERCEALAPGLLVRTGNQAAVEEELRTLERLTRSVRPHQSSQTHRGELRNHLREQEALRRQLAEVARRERELADLGRLRFSYAERRHSDPQTLATALGDDVSLGRWLRRARTGVRLGIFGGWLRSRCLSGLAPLSVQAATRPEFADLVSFAEAEADWRQKSVEADAVADDHQLLTVLRETDRRVRETAAALLRATVAEQATIARAAIHDRVEAVKSRSPRQWSSLERILPQVSGWAVTARSPRRFRDRAALFDLVIVDEASQCSTPDVLPLLFRARRVLVIGDPMQLQHITTLQPRQEAEAHRGAGLRASWLDEHRFDHRRYSSFHAAAHAAGKTLLLDEHFRCHPDIVGISNQHCYGDRLTVLTEPRSLRRLEGVDAVQWLDVAGTARRGSNGSWMNQEEADRVHLSVERLLLRLPQGSTVGVVTPFRAQKDLIAERWKHESRVRVGTVHTFQGGQQDVILLSLVAGARMRPSAVSWLCREVNLWNVAITRARSHLIVFGDRDFWSTRAGMPHALLDAAEAKAALSSFGAESGQQDELVGDRLQRLLTDEISEILLDRNVTTDGYACDFDVRRGAGAAQVQLDYGASADVEDARHLRLALSHADLLPNGVRLPAWHVWAGRTERVTGRLSGP